VVVDDGSGDGTYEAAEDFRPRMRGIELTVVSQDNAGPGAARNRALSMATTRFVAFLDADDEWLPEKLAQSIAALGDRLTLVSHNYIRILDSVETMIDCARNFPVEGDQYVGLFMRNFIATSTVVARRAAVAAADGFDETLPSGQDYKLWLTIAGLPNTDFAVLDQALTRYHVTANSVSSNVAMRRACQTRIMREQLPRLCECSASPLRAALWRTLLIARESVQMYLTARRPIAALASCARLAGELVATAQIVRRVKRGHTT
jgi:glycosyltransferase involved in cell wall biosynthesis